jgi:hypothetical protein
MELFMRLPKSWTEKLAEMNHNFNRKADEYARENPIEQIQTNLWFGHCRSHGICDHDKYGCIVCNREIELAWAKRIQERGFSDDDIPF